MSRFDNGVVQLYQGDARQVLGELPAESVHCVVTSPPYWGLRDYGLEALVWGGADAHKHEWGAPILGKTQSGSLNGSSLEGTPPGAERRPEWESAFCPCGAWRGSLGLEPTIDLYVQHIVEIFREVRRVLRKDGTLWLNMGDSYATGTSAGSKPSPQTDVGYWQEADKLGRSRIDGKADGLKPKDLCMMPARVALALQADGWWLRSDVVWSKPNPMPESVTDRPTRAHEYVFLLTKAERYFYDADAIREPHQDVLGIERFKHSGGNNADYNPTESQGWHGHGMKLQPGRREYHPAGRNKRSVWEIATEPMGYEWCRGCGMVYTATEYRRLSAGAARRCTTELDDSGDDQCGGTRWEGLESGRLVCMACEVEYAKSAVDKMPRAARCRHCQRDDAWGSHFATFPQKLVEPCILAGTSERGVCPDCGAPWERVVERTPMEIDRSNNHPPELRTRTSGTMTKAATTTTTGWRPTCGCGHENTIPAKVLDPFAGSGTVAYVAQRLGRRAIGIDLSAEYLALAEKRLRGQTLPMIVG